MGACPERHRQQQREFWEELATLRDPAVHERLRHLQREAARREWLTTRRPPAQAECDALSATELASRTSAPITQCTPARDNRPHPSHPPLHFLRLCYAADATHEQLVRRARLLYDRSYTAAARFRFPSQAAAPITSAQCTNAACTEDETVEHILLHCPRHQGARARLRRALRRQCGLKLSLRTVLNPPVKGRANYRAAYDATNTFLQSIADTRQRLGLPSLDTRPAAPLPPPHAAPRPTGPVWARQRALRRAALAARAVPAPLDTG